MERFLEQRYVIKFSSLVQTQLGKTGKENHDMIKEAYGTTTMGRWGVFEWHKLFRLGRDEDRSRYPSTSKTKKQNVSRVKKLLSSDPRRNIRMIADELSIPQTQVFEILKGTLAVRKVCAFCTGVSCPAQCATRLHPLTAPTWPRQTFFSSQE
ncbi:protein GVQW3 [Trichonephila clavipes]|nr:protein GVQW3 [Trichonephila clavipes]